MTTLLCLIPYYASSPLSLCYTTRSIRSERVSLANHKPTDNHFNIIDLPLASVPYPLLTMSDTSQSVAKTNDDNPKDPRSEVTETITCEEQTWTIPNFVTLLKAPTSIDDVQAKIASFNRHVFYIRLPSTTPTATQPTQLKVEAHLSLNASISHLNIVFSLPDKKAYPQWTVQVTDIPVLQSSTPGHPRGYFNTDLLPMYAIFHQTTQRQLVRLEKVDLISEDYKCALPLPSLTMLSAFQMMESFLNALNIQFTVQFTITRPPGQSPTIPQLLRSSNLLESDFKALLNDSATADVELKVIQGGNKSFQCHKAVLSARSPVFRRIFLGSFRDTNATVLEIPEIPADAMAHFLSFIYTGHFQDSSWTTSLRYLACVADKYSVNSLKELCDSNLIRSVTCTNALALGKLAERIGLMKAAKDIRQFIADNARELTLDLCEDD